MGGRSCHHIANVYHCPVTVSVSPEATFADEVNDRKVKKIAGQAKVTAGVGPADAELGASASYMKEVDRSGVHSRHDDNFVEIHPGRIKRVGTGRGDFVTITVEEQGTTRYIAKNHKLREECGLIVRPDGSLADTGEKIMRSLGCNTDYTCLAAAIRDQVAEEQRKLRAANVSEKDEQIRLRELQNELINKQDVNMDRMWNLIDEERKETLLAEIPKERRQRLMHDIDESHVYTHNLSVDVELTRESHEALCKMVEEEERQVIRDILKKS